MLVSLQLYRRPNEEQWDMARRLMEKTYWQIVLRDRKTKKGHNLSPGQIWKENKGTLYTAANLESLEELFKELCESGEFKDNGLIPIGTAGRTTHSYRKL